MGFPVTVTYSTIHEAQGAQMYKTATVFSTGWRLNLAQHTQPPPQHKEMESTAHSIHLPDLELGEACRGPSLMAGPHGPDVEWPSVTTTFQW